MKGGTHMDKYTDKLCLDCSKLDSCDKKNSKNCNEYEYYKCTSCSNRVIDSNNARCLRGGNLCKGVKYCMYN